MDAIGRASRALVGSLAVNAALIALLLAIAPRREAAKSPPSIVDISTTTAIATPPPSVVAAIAAATPAPVGQPHHHAAPAPAPAPAAPNPGPDPDDAASELAGSGTGGSGDGGTGSGDGGGGVGGTGTGGAASTMPIPRGPRTAQLPYTREALGAHARGVVAVRVVVGADGKVHDTALVRGLGYGLDALALAAKLEFEPARDASGVATTAQLVWKFHFTPPAQL